MLQLAPSNISAEDIATELIKANGRQQLAAERLHIDVGELIAILADDPVAMASFQKQIKVLATVRSLEALSQIQCTFIATVASLEPYEAVKAFTGVLGVLTNLTDDKTQTHNVNLYESVMSIMPAPARAALKVVMSGEVSDEVDGEIDF